jgi:hypothetical protein
MDRRLFLRSAGALTLVSSLPRVTRAFAAEGGRISLPRMTFAWQGLQTTRPFTPDVDPEGRIWFGSSKFFCYDPGLGTTKMLDNTPLEGKPYSTCLCQGEKVYVLTQKSPLLYVYNQRTRAYATHQLPDAESNIWFGARVPGDPRLYLYVRNRSKLVVWDTEVDRGHEIPYPESMDLWSGFYVKDDNALYSFTIDAKPCRLVRFDLARQKFDTIIPGPEPGCEITGVNPVGQSVYCADRFTGRLFPFDFVRRKWGAAIPVPGYKKVFGFIGMGTTFNGLALYCLSTYKGTMKWDFNSNKYLSTGDENIGIDGRPHHFINRYLVYDPGAGEFGFLEAPEEKGKRYPLICYSLVTRNRLFITGYDLGDISRTMKPMGEKEGELCLFQSAE